MNKLRIAVLALAPIVALSAGCAVQRESKPVVVERDRPVVVERQTVIERDKPDVDVHIDR